MASTFQTFSPSYENITNRMNRLRHGSSGHHSSYSASLPKHSPPRNINLLTLDTNCSKYARRVSPTAFNLREDPPSCKFAGRVTKNVGLKKYNQRQLREVMNHREPTHLKTESNYYMERENYAMLFTETNTMREVTTGDKRAAAAKASVDEVKMNEEAKDNISKINGWQTKLVPGRMYKR
jgi:hypothetical protein